MPRRVQDILPGDRRSIRDIAVPRHSDEKTAVKTISHLAFERKAPRTKGETELKIHRVEERSERNEKEPMRRMAMTPPPAKRKSFKKKWVWLTIMLGIIVIVAGAAFIASTYFSRAVFTITPKVIPITVNSPLVIKAGVSTDSGDLTYEVITMKATQSVTVPAADGPVISVKAGGKVNLYNAYSASSIRLIAGTRISGDSGLIYRLTSSVVIPGLTKPSGSIVAGSVSTSIIADQAGPEYNISRADSISDFKIVAYKGGLRYDTVYARLTSDVSGGAMGTKKIVPATVLASSTTALKSSILTSLLTQVRNQVPKDYVMRLHSVRPRSVAQTKIVLQSPFKELYMG
jgi:hypothetical protein